MNTVEVKSIETIVTTRTFFEGKVQDDKTFFKNFPTKRNLYLSNSEVSEIVGSLKHTYQYDKRFVINLFENHTSTVEEF